MNYIYAETGIVLPAPPSQTSYPIGIPELYLVPSYNIEQYRKAFRRDPAPFDQYSPVKLWAVPPGTLPVTMERFQYLVWNGSNFETRSMDSVRACNYNIPGIKKMYAPYQANIPDAADRATYTFMNTERPMRDQDLCLLDDAEQVEKELGVVCTGLAAFPYPINWHNDPRRNYYCPTYRCSTSYLVFLANQAGVGRPGKWDVVSGVPSFFPDPIYDGTEHEVKFETDQPPVRPLYDGEYPQRDAFTVWIRYEDPTIPAGAATDFTSDDRSTLIEIRDGIRKILAGDFTPTTAK